MRPSRRSPVSRLVQTAKFKRLYGLDGPNVNVTSTLDISARDIDIHMVSKSGNNDDQAGPGRGRQDALWPRRRWPMKKVRRPDSEQDITDTVQALHLIRNPLYLAYVGVETIDKHSSIT